MRQKLFLLMLWLLALPAGAAEVAGVRLPDYWMLDGHALPLNGIGVREYGLLKIDVYVAALYLPKPDQDPVHILAAPGPKVIQMQFLRDINREDALKVWDHYFAENCKSPCVLPAAEIAAFKAFAPTTVKGDTQTYLFYDNHVEVLANGKPIGKVGGPRFPRLLLSTWIGDYPPTPALRRALLGRSES